MLSIKGIRIAAVHVAREESGKYKVSGSYELISSKDTVLANQTYGDSYGAVPMPMSIGTASLLNQFMEAYKADMQSTVGLED